MMSGNNDLIIARIMLSAQAEVILSRKERKQRIIDKAVKAYSERNKPKEQRKPMTAGERKAVMNSLKNLNK